jgi:hypothetical protein
MNLSMLIDNEFVIILTCVLNHIVNENFVMNLIILIDNEFVIILTCVLNHVTNCSSCN